MARKIEKKICTCCGKELQLKEFYKSSSELYTDGKLPICKECFNERFSKLLNLYDGKINDAWKHLCYNLDKADITQQIIELDNFNTEGNTIACALVDERFLNFHYALQDGGLIYNPKALATNHFWNSWSINTASLFKNAVLFKFEEKPAAGGGGA